MRRLPRCFPMGDLSFSILNRALALCCVLSGMATLALVYAGGYTFENALIYAYVEAIEACAFSLLAIGLWGSLILDDTLQHLT